MYRLQLDDGRHLDYKEFGDPDGQPVIYCHGCPGSSFDASITHVAAQKIGARIIAPNRPGYGQSDFLSGRRIGDWPKDVSDLAKILGLKKYAILGVSAGGPYALACAEQLTSLTSVGVVSGLGPMDNFQSTKGMTFSARLTSFLAHHIPALTQFFYEKLFTPLFLHYPNIPLAMLSGTAPAADRVVLQYPIMQEMLLKSLRETFRQGGRGPTLDLMLFTHSWGINLKKIPVKVLLWHGEDDGTVPVEMAQNNAREIPDCRATFLPKEGHFSLPVNHMEEILTGLLKS
jgi:pimeloyl-ACP methyl ester carboxylesterase